MTPAVPRFEELAAPADWRAVDFISDLHLQAEEPATFEAWRRYMERTRADALFILGDLFEVWVGDDCLDDAGGFEARCCEVLRATARRMPVHYLHGNRDFLAGERFLAHCGLRGLHEPTVLAFGPGARQRFVLSHGDLLCLDDVAYQRFRAEARGAAWQARFLAQPLAVRREQARAIRLQSEAKRQQQQAGPGTGGPGATGLDGTTDYDRLDLDTDATRAWLAAARAGTLIHGHTHRPAEHALGPIDGAEPSAPGRRVVLSDWDAAASPPRAEVLRLALRESSAPALERRPAALS
ncbi:UDP-2,3-diacylglucosamine diphosphatase [Paracidovorax anthurii]|uniref:UDP-2,3-diacylglucosamine hydrolase n=1 Tax=Paracidovorax anthurii TaxID=78229 RepID=A0A328ZME9_9BURK|nr:UDP-2,3-diacylglucosamine diphosphatase [Paracidovorax anthurii]RAR86203.1 UDP-2,3-diacylglucosamine hydrolase [Paracidovorax anthurii]